MAQVLFFCTRQLSLQSVALQLAAEMSHSKRLEDLLSREAKEARLTREDNLRTTEELQDQMDLCKRLELELSQVRITAVTMAP